MEGKDSLTEIAAVLDGDETHSENGITVIRSESLRKLRESNAELLEALRNILADVETANDRRKPQDWDFACFHAEEYARAAIAKIEGKTR